MIRRKEVTQPPSVYSERPPGFVLRELQSGRRRVSARAVLCCDALPLTKLAERYGTPLYVYSATAIRERLAAFENAFRDVSHTICYSVKANSNLTILRLLARNGSGFDVVSGGELERVLAADRRAARKIVFSGVGKSRDEMAAALKAGILLFNVESESELLSLAECTGRLRKVARVALRVNPDVAADTHPYISTGLHKHKFGVPIGTARALYAEAARAEYLKVAGVSVHIGSQITSLDGFEAAARRLVAFMAGLGGLPELNLGGGHAVPYRPGEDGLDITAFAERITRVVEQECAAHRIPVPRLTIEPGRAIIGAAGVTLYRVLAVKHGARTFVVVDGGMSDNPRPALYGSRYHIERAGAHTAAGNEPMTVVGRHCEAGDVLVPDARLPADLRPGDLLTVPCTGAYHHAMASNYNHLTRPPVIAAHEGHAWPLIRRETAGDLLRRDVG